MKRWIVLAAALAVGLAGCSKKTTAGAPAPMPGQKSSAEAMLAYSHSMSVELPTADIPPRIDAIRMACISSAHGACNLLNVDQSSTGGSITVRIVPEGVQPLAEMAGAGGKVSSRTTSAEDISDAVHETQRDRDQLEAYAKRLDDIAARKDLSVTDLIAVSKEQAAVAEKRRILDNAAADQHHRLDTNLLRISFNDPRARASRREFGDIGPVMVDSALDGTADALAALAEGLPYLIIAFPLAWLWWLAWRKVTRRWRK